MTKLLLTTIIFFGYICSSEAQIMSNDAIGIRLSEGEGFSAAITYQHAFSEHNRIELDLGLSNGKRYDGFKLTALDQMVWRIKNTGLNWYVGAGGGIASYNFDFEESNSRIKDTFTFLFLALNSGIEYNFDIPIVISFDIRPELGLSDSNFRNDNFELDFGIAIRYQF
jgi:hypothetical protein